MWIEYHDWVAHSDEGWGSWEVEGVELHWFGYLLLLHLLLGGVDQGGIVQHLEEACTLSGVGPVSEWVCKAI